MSSYRIRGTTLTDIADAIREKTGSAEPMAVSDMADQIRGITGGGSAEGAVYVRFMNHDGTQELYKKPVFAGDHCMDPVEMGWLETPTRDPSNTQVFTYSGWAREANGDADASVLLNIAGDTTVYAAYTSATRYYTVRFFDGETLLNTMQVAYGATAAYTAVKHGYGFDGWQPSNENIVADTDCYAQWSETITFANGSWEQISQICEAGQAAQYFIVGDTKQFTNGTYPFTARIIGIEYDDKTDGSGKAGITVALSPSYVTKQYNVNTATGFWYVSSTLCCTLRTWLQGEFFTDYLPSDLQAVIKTVNKVTYNSTSKTTTTAPDTIFLPDRDECFGTKTYRDVEAYPGLADQANRVQYDADGNAVTWWRRSGYQSAAGLTKANGSNAGETSTSVTAENHVMPCFCI